jgi:hypothetical protein
MMGTALGTIGLVALAVLPLPASAASTSDYSLSCKGDGSGSISWSWTSDGSVIATGSLVCYGDATQSGTGIERPAGANGLTVTATATGYAEETQKTVSKSFAVDGSFNLNVKVSVSENYRDHLVGRFHVQESTVFSMSG